jgi:GH24 family phage-related lysozyme (muramidase)
MSDTSTSDKQRSLFTRPNEESRVEMKNTQGKITDIPAQIRSMKRLWVGKGLDGLIKRREGEAALFEEGLNQ